MKKIISFLALFAGLTMFTACSDSDATYTATEPLNITQADVLFGAGGGDGSIVVNTSSSLTATTDASWINLNVNGNTVTATCQPNSSIEGRSAKIVLTATDGATANVTATQHGLLIQLDAKSAYLFNSDDNEPAFVPDRSNIDFEKTISDSWIHFEKAEKGYNITVDPNEGSYRNGTIELAFAASNFKQTIRIGQWGESLPFENLTKALYEDSEGNTYAQPVTVVADASQANTYLVKGLMQEGDLAVTLNTKNQSMVEYYVPAGYKVGTMVEDGKTLTLRCLMSAFNVNTDRRYYPTAVTTLENNEWRMAFEWQVDEMGMPTLNYVRNANLGQTYRTDGILVYQFSTATGAMAAARKGLAYEFLNLKFIIE